MARKIKLTDGRIGKLKAGDIEYMVWDTRIAGFGVRVRPTGHKSYVYHRHAEGQSRKFTLGPVSLGSVDEARRDCMKVWGRMQSGERAEGADGAQAPLFRDFVAGSWRAACYEPCKQSTKTSKDWALNNQLVPVFGAMPLDRIDRDRCHPVVRGVQCNSTRRRELGAACVPADHEPCNFPRAHRDQPDPGPEEESAPQAHPLPIARGNRPSP